MFAYKNPQKFNNNACPKSGGYTLLELITTVAVLAILVALATPSLTQFLQNREIRSQASQLQQAFSTARSSAISKGAGASVCWNGGTANASLPAGMVADNSFQLAPGELAVIDSSGADMSSQIVSQYSVQNDGYNLIDNAASPGANRAKCVSYDTQGRLVGSAVILSACKDGGDDANAISIQVGLTGRASQLKGNAIAGATCS